MTELLTRFPDMSDEHLTEDQIAHIGNMPEAASAAQSVSEFRERIESFEERHEKFDSAKEAAGWVANIDVALRHELTATIDQETRQLLPQEDEKIAKQAQAFFDQGLYVTELRNRFGEGQIASRPRRALHFKDSAGGMYHIEPKYDPDATTARITYTTNPDTKYAYTEEVFVKTSFDIGLVTRKYTPKQSYGRRARNSLFPKGGQEWDEVHNGPGAEVDSKEAEALELYYKEFVDSARAALETVFESVGTGDSFVEHQLELTRYKQEEQRMMRLEDTRARKAGRSFLKRVMRRHN